VSVYPFIEAEKAGSRNVKRACALLQVSRAASYQHCRGNRSPREREDAGLTAQIRAVHEESKGRYGAPRIHAELCRRVPKRWYSLSDRIARPGPGGIGRWMRMRAWMLGFSSELRT